MYAQVGRVLHGVVCHFPRMTTILVYMVSSLGSGLATVLMPASDSVTGELQPAPAGVRHITGQLQLKIAIVVICKH